MSLSNKFILHKLILSHNFKNFLDIFSLDRVVLNLGCKNAVLSSKKVISAGLALKFITGNLPIPIRSTKSVMFLKVRSGMLIGCKVILKKIKLYGFLELFILKLQNKIFESKKFNLNFFTCFSKDILLNLDDLFIFKKLEYFFDYFSGLPKLNIVFIFNKNLNLFSKIFFLRIIGLKYPFNINK